MLQFILGRASSGKTYTVIQKIAECISQGESSVLLVPEQFSFESEKNIDYAHVLIIINIR